MLILILGADAKTILLLDTLTHTGESLHVVGWFDSDAVGDELALQCPQGNRFASAEEFAQAVTGDATVVVGPSGDESKKEKLLRELARDGIPLILQQPVCSGIFAVEMDMIQRDTEAPMVPYYPAAHHPVFARMAQWTRGDTSPVGSIEQVVMERALANRSDESVRAELARDAILLRRLLGKFQRVGAMPAKEVKSLHNLSVQLTGDAKAVARWTVGPVTQTAGATLSLIGERGRITLNMPDEGDWRLESTSDDLPSETLAPLDEVAHGQTILAALHGEPRSPTWEDAFRATDLADLACESVRRGKTLPVSNERLTEEDTFKGLMAAGGCLIILLIPFVLLFVSLFDGLEIPRHRTKILSVQKGEREITLPGDVEAVDYLKRVADDATLPAKSHRDLLAEYGAHTTGKPAAYHLSRNSITLAPAADSSYDFELAYEGSFRIWQGWPFLLLSPIVIFLGLQLLKLVFPKPNSGK